MTDGNSFFQVAEMGLPRSPLDLPALPPLLPPVEGDHPRCRVLLPGGHHPGLHLPWPRGGPDANQQQPAQFPDGQPETAAGVAAAAAAASSKQRAAWETEERNAGGCWCNNTTKWLPPPGHSCAPNRFWPFKLQHSWWLAAAAAAALGRNMPCSSKLCCSSALSLHPAAAATSSPALSWIR